MTAETCRHCGGRIAYEEGEYVPASLGAVDVWWYHTEPHRPYYAHDAEPAFGGGS